jgi:hypothetical protein
MSPGGTPEDTSRTSPRVSLLRCLKCGNTVECLPADLLRFTRTKWLRCCDEVMTLFVPVDKQPPKT